MEMKIDEPILKKQSSDDVGNHDSQVNQNTDAFSERGLIDSGNTCHQALPPSGQGQVAMQFKGMADSTAPQSENKNPVQRKENRTGLPDTLKSGIESLSGYSMDDVKVHYNSSRPAQLQAHAFARGTDIHLASGQEKHLPHEAWHVVQQKQGRVRPTVQMKGKVQVNDDAGLEREADVMGAKANSCKNFINMNISQQKIVKNKRPSSQNNVICQREIVNERPKEMIETKDKLIDVMKKILGATYDDGWMTDYLESAWIEFGTPGGGSLQASRGSLQISRGSLQISRGGFPLMNSFIKLLRGGKHSPEVNISSEKNITTINLLNYIKQKISNGEKEFDRFKTGLWFDGTSEKIKDREKNVKPKRIVFHDKYKEIPFYLKEERGGNLDVSNEKLNGIIDDAREKILNSLDDLTACFYYNGGNGRRKIVEGSGALKSRAKIDGVDRDDASGNTTAEDKKLENHGYVFHFIEHEKLPPSRKTRYAKKSSNSEKGIRIRRKLRWCLNQPGVLIQAGDLLEKNSRDERKKFGAIYMPGRIIGVDESHDGTELKKYEPTTTKDKATLMMEDFIDHVKEKLWFQANTFPVRGDEEKNDEVQNKRVDALVKEYDQIKDLPEAQFINAFLRKYAQAQVLFPTEIFHWEGKRIEDKFEKYKKLHKNWKSDPTKPMALDDDELDLDDLSAGRLYVRRLSNISEERKSEKIDFSIFGRQ